MPAVIATAAVAPLHAAPSLRSEQVSQLVLGDAATVLATADEWLHVRGAHDGYAGWVHRGYVLERTDEEARAWGARADGWSEGARLRVDGALVRAPLRARLVLEGDAVTLPDGRRGVVVDGAVLPIAAARADACSQSPETWALERFEGAPYEWGGVTPRGVDCSGLVQTTFAARGTALPRDAALQAETGVAVAPGDARPSDLLFFAEPAGRISHVAMLGRDETLVHATVACGGVLRESWRPGSRAAPLRERLVAVRRVGGNGA